MPETIQVAREGPVTTIVFDRPAARNALDRAMADETRAALAACNADGDCGAVVLTGAGDKAFCAGMDLALTRGFDEAGVREWLVWLRAFYESIRGLDKPCVAAVNGVAAAAGYQIALLADLRIGHAGARMGQPEIDMGLASVLGAHLMAAQSRPFTHGGADAERPADGRQGMPYAWALPRARAGEGSTRGGRRGGPFPRREAAGRDAADQAAPPRSHAAGIRRRVRGRLTAPAGSLALGRTAAGDGGLPREAEAQVND